MSTLISIPPGTYDVDIEKSYIEWEGGNLLGRHRGKVQIDAGSVVVGEYSHVNNCHVLVDMESITDTDCSEKLKKKITSQISSINFFNVGKYPLSEFNLIHAEKLKDAPLGKPNYLIEGELTIKGITHSLKLYAYVSVFESGIFECVAQFRLDRRIWNAYNMYDVLLEFTGDYVVDALINIKVKIYAKRMFQQTPTR